MFKIILFLENTIAISLNGQEHGFLEPVFSHYLFQNACIVFLCTLFNSCLWMEELHDGQDSQKVRSQK